MRTGKKNSSDREIISEILTEYELIVDSYEQDIQRPKKYEKQKEYYSGKKKSHTRKSQVIVLSCR
ncbi:MAG: transposase family protein [Okeania sp. SIO2G4]|uniref:transposase family protein n=1 Tax=unclassified Okeania TaxID=2634635 RepID=UPI0013C0779D|nr:transposase family protein [Okeania sp. SIO4D6]NEP46473.1 transposase family protein [Okeania sp. SIO2H7]NEP76509.1 transposase family protein [Okeania sp. SIO2G5]NEQ95111.1 transposase family protein [Okeania sp. SIO2G4]